MSKRSVLLTLAVVLVAIAGCSKGAPTSGAPGTSAVTTVTTVAATPSTTGGDQPVTGTDDNSVQERLRNATTAEMVLYTDNSAYTADLATLRDTEPTLTWISGLTPPPSPMDVAVAVASGGQYACLTGKAATGHVFVYVLDPSHKVYGGATRLNACDAGVIAHLSPLN